MRPLLSLSKLEGLCILRGPMGIKLRGKTLSKTEHLSGVTKWVTSIRIGTPDP